MKTGVFASIMKSLTAKFIINTLAGVCNDLHLKKHRLDQYNIISSAKLFVRKLSDIINFNLGAVYDYIVLLITIITNLMYMKITSEFPKQPNTMMTAYRNPRM